MVEVNEENDDVVLNEGDCFGWYSSVNIKCQPNSCMLSERCKFHTISLQQSTMPSVNEQPLTVKKTPDESTDEKKRTSENKDPKRRDELYRGAFFDNIVNSLKNVVKHDDIHYNPNRTFVSFKENKQITVAVYRNTKQITVAVRKEDKNEEKLEISFDEEVEIGDANKRVINFIKRELSC
jgi:hypothetical protein